MSTCKLSLVLKASLAERIEEYISDYRVNNDLRGERSQIGTYSIPGFLPGHCAFTITISNERGNAAEIREQIITRFIVSKRKPRFSPFSSYQFTKAELQEIRQRWLKSLLRPGTHFGYRKGSKCGTILRRDIVFFFWK